MATFSFIILACLSSVALVAGAGVVNPVLANAYATDGNRRKYVCSQVLEKKHRMSKGDIEVLDSVCGTVADKTCAAWVKAGMLLLTTLPFHVTRR